MINIDKIFFTLMLPPVPEKKRRAEGKPKIHPSELKVNCNLLPIMQKSFYHSSTATRKDSIIKVACALAGLVLRNHARSEAIEPQPLSSTIDPLTYTVAEVQQPVHTDPQFTLRCTCVKVPTISIIDYLLRFHSDSISPICFTAAFIYICRLETADEITVSAINLHRLALVSLRLANKIVEDRIINNKTFASRGGIRVRELNTLEVACIEKLNWRLHISEADFQYYEGYMDLLAEEYLQHKKALRNSFASIL